MKKFLRHTFLIFSIIILNSCLGIFADIQMRRDGSGKITLEYRFSRMAETVGRLDGNENWPIIPIGREDWQRTIARIPGMKLASFSSRETDRDIVNKVTLEFKNTEALLKFLDPSGGRAVLTRENGANKLHITLSEPASEQINPDLLELMRRVSEGYSFRISFRAAGNSTATLTDGEGNAASLPEGTQIVSSGKKVSLAIDTAEILSKADGLGISFNWE